MLGIHGSSIKTAYLYYYAILSRVSMCKPRLASQDLAKRILSKPNNDADKCLITCVEKAIKGATGRYPVISTSGGTSDGRFFASERTQVVEVGVPNTTIHQVNEHIHFI